MLRSRIQLQQKHGAFSLRKNNTPCNKPTDIIGSSGLQVKNDRDQEAIFPSAASDTKVLMLSRQGPAAADLLRGEESALDGRDALVLFQRGRSTKGLASPSGGGGDPYFLC